MVKDGAIVGFGDVCPDEFHPKQNEVIDGISYVYPIDKAGVERKWRYARQSVEGIASLMRAKQTSYGYEIELGKNVDRTSVVEGNRVIVRVELGVSL